MPLSRSGPGATISSGANLGASAQELRGLGAKAARDRTAIEELANAAARAFDLAQEAIQALENRQRSLGEPVLGDTSRRAPVRVSGDRISGGLQIQGVLPPPHGQGLELVFDSQTGRILAYDRGADTYLALTIGGSTVTFTGTVTMTSPVLVTPTIASFTNAQHNHQNAAGGGTLAEAALVLTDTTTNDASATKHGFAPKLLNCGVYKSGTQSINDATTTALTFDSESFDNGAFHSTVSNTERLTIPVAGKYMIGGSVEFAASAVGNRFVTVRQGGTTNLGAASGLATSAFATRIGIPPLLVDFAANDYIEVTVYQDTGGALNVSGGAGVTTFWTERVG